MVKVQKLKEPKKNSGTKLEYGQSCKLSGIEVKNTNRFAVYVDAYIRKKQPRKIDL